jgi:hypothetical protein
VKRREEGKSSSVIAIMKEVVVKENANGSRRRVGGYDRVVPLIIVLVIMRKQPARTRSYHEKTFVDMKNAV